MKEKVIITLSFASFIGIMWLSSTIKTTNPNPAISEENTSLPIDNYSKDHIDDIVFEYMQEEMNKSLDAINSELINTFPTLTKLFNESKVSSILTELSEFSCSYSNLPEKEPAGLSGQ